MNERAARCTPLAAPGHAQRRRPRCQFLLLLALLALVCGSAWADDWPGWRGLEKQGRAEGDAPVEWAPDRNVRWQTSIPGQGHSSPVVAGDRVVVTTAYATERGTRPKRIAGWGTVALTGFICIIAVAYAVPSGWTRRRLIVAACFCLIVGAWLHVTFAARVHYGARVLSNDERMESWLFSTKALSLALLVAMFSLSSRSLLRFLAVGVALLAAGAVVWGRPMPEYFYVSGPERYTRELHQAVAAPVVLALAMLAVAVLRRRWPGKEDEGAGPKRDVPSIIVAEAALVAGGRLARGLPAAGGTGSALRALMVSFGRDELIVLGGCLCTNLDGDVLWTNTDVPFDEVHGVAVSPMPADGLLVIASGQPKAPYVTALDQETGERVWTTRLQPWPGIEGQHRTPTIVVLDGKPVVLYWGWEGAEKQDFLWAFDARTGAERRRRPVPTDGEAVASVLADGDTLYLPGQKAFRALSLAKLAAGEDPVLWTADLKGKGPYASSPVLANGLLFMVANHRHAWCLDAATGEVQWQERLKGRGAFPSPVAAGGRIYFCDKAGLTTVLAAAREFRVLAENDLGEPIWASPAAADGRLTIRTTRHLWCIEARKGEAPAEPLDQGADR